jgi:hypothetical protein
VHRRDSQEKISGPKWCRSCQMLWPWQMPHHPYLYLKDIEIKGRIISVLGNTASLLQSQILISILWTFDKIHSQSHLVLGFSLWGGCCWSVPVSWFFSYGRLHVSRNLSIFSHVTQIAGIVLLRIALHDSYFWGICCNVSSSISDFLWIFSWFFLL